MDFKTADQPQSGLYVSIAFGMEWCRAIGLLPEGLGTVCPPGTHSSCNVVLKLYNANTGLYNSSSVPSHDVLRWFCYGFIVLCHSSCNVAYLPLRQNVRKLVLGTVASTFCFYVMNEAHKQYILLDTIVN